jgi:hypothetical protein
MGAYISQKRYIMTYNNEDWPIYSVLNGKPGYVYDYFGNCNAQGYPI